MIIDFDWLNQIPGAIGFKDKNSVYLGGNQLLASTMGFDKPQDIVGMKDTDIKSEMVAFADKFMKEDKVVLLAGERQHIDIGRYNDGKVRAILSTKKVLFTANNEIIGTVFSRVELNSLVFNKLLEKIPNIKLPQYYTISRKYDEYNFNKRETESLFYLIRGYTAREIAERLGLSPKTQQRSASHQKTAFI